MKVCGVIVAYETNIARLENILQSLLNQCDVIVVDNSESYVRSSEICACVALYRQSYISMEGNQGIGAAINAGINLAWKIGADAILLLDDDSIPQGNLVNILSECRAPDVGEMAIFCAKAVDASGREISNIDGQSGHLVRCRDLMSSGTLIRRSLLERIGLFDEKLFIDCVDFDWGWRAKRLGISIYICRKTSITHKLGEGRIAGLRFPSPVRHYYQYRNILHMMTRSYTPWAWRASQSIKLITKLILILLLMQDKRLRLNYAFMGMCDAIRGRNGQCPKS